MFPEWTQISTIFSQYFHSNWPIWFWQNRFLGEKYSGKRNTAWFVNSSMALPNQHLEFGFGQTKSVRDDPTF